MPNYQRLKKSSSIEEELLPEEIYAQILGRLPVKCICRFKSVSKTWNLIICSPQFISSYVPRSPPTWVILNRSVRLNHDDYSLTFNIGEPPNASYLSLPQNLFDDLSVVSISNGLLLLSSSTKRPHNFYVVDPISRKWIRLPDSPRPTCDDDIGFATQVSPGGVLERFRIAEYRPWYGDYREGSRRSFTIPWRFSSEIGNWELNPAKCYSYGIAKRGFGTYDFNGHLIWTNPMCNEIRAVDDPFGEGMKAHGRIISLPGGFDWRKFREDRTISVGQEYIEFLLVEKASRRLSFWRLVDYAKGKWSLLHKVSVTDILSNESLLLKQQVLPLPCLTHPLENGVAFFRVEDRVFSLDVGTKRVQNCSGPLGQVHLPVIPLVLPDWPITLSPNLSVVGVELVKGTMVCDGKSACEICASEDVLVCPEESCRLTLPPDERID